MRARSWSSTPGSRRRCRTSGDPGWAHLGVPPRAPSIRRLAAFVNRLVGNPVEARRDRDLWPLGRARHRPRCWSPAASSWRRSRSATARRYRTAGGSVGCGTTSRSAAGSRSHRCSARGRPTRCPGSARPCSRRRRALASAPTRGTRSTTDQAPLAEPRRVARVGPGPRVDWFEPASFERLVAACLDGAAIRAESGCGCRAPRCAEAGHRRAAQRGAGAGRDPGAARRRAGDDARRSPHHRRISRGRRGATRRRGDGRPGPAGRRACASPPRHGRRHVTDGRRPDPSVDVPVCTGSAVTVQSMDRRIFGIESEFGVTCTLRGQRRLEP